MGKNIARKYLSYVYKISIAVAIVTHVFNKIEIGGGLKLFHVPTIIALIFGFFISNKKDSFFKYIAVISSITILSSICSYYTDSINDAITYIIVAFGCLALRYCYDRNFILIINSIIPIAVYSLLMLYRTDVYFRFSGYYNDPNYLCTTLLVFLYFIIALIKSEKRKYIIGLAIVEIVFVLFLISTTVSRAGLLCSGILLFGSFLDVLRKYKIQAIILVIFAFFVLKNNFEIIDNLIHSLERRSNSGDSVDSASTYRMMISLNGISHILTHPYLIFTGVGIGATAHSTMIPDFINHGIMECDHNTWTSFFSEQGIVSFGLFVTMVLKIFTCAWKSKNEYRLINFISFSSLIVFSFSIMQKTYLPFWVLFFVISNVEYENSSHIRLRKK